MLALSKIYSHIHSIKAHRKRTIKLQLYKAHTITKENKTADTSDQRNTLLYGGILLAADTA